MKQDKTKILSDLYAIRATLSLIAENDEKTAEPERQAIIGLKQEQQKDQYVLNRSKEEIGKGLQETIERDKYDVHDYEKDYESDKEELNHSFIYRLWWTLWEGLYTYAALGLILLLFTFASIGVSFGCGSLWNDLDYWHGVLYTAIICFSVIVAYLLFICIPFAILERRSWMKYTKSSKAKLQEKAQKLQEETELYEVTRKRAAEETDFWHDICQTVTASEHLTPYIIGLFQWHEEKIIEIEQKKENFQLQRNLHCERLKTNGEKISAIVESATKAYPLIDLRDWENVDLLIYYFETGRADDMKEALQLVDRQRQTEMLAKAIAMASEEICKTIHQSMNQLGNALAQSFSLLSSQMARQHDELLRGMEEQTAAQKEASEAQIKAIHAQTAAQVTSQEMNRALLAKISSSSADLAHQMHRQMREVHGIPV